MPEGQELVKIGRPSAYRPEFAEQARKLCLVGYTDEQLADFFEVCVATIYNWRNEHPAFLEAIRAGKAVADAEVADSLYKRATGEHVQMEKLVKVQKDGQETYEAVRYKQWLPGDPTAAFRWLLNRQPQYWRDKRELEHSGDMTVSTKEQRDAAIAAASRADG